MTTDTIDAAALTMLVEAYWDEFVEFSGDEESAEMTLRALWKEAVMR